MTVRLFHWLLMAIVAAGQLAVPGYMIVQRERLLASGTAYKFRTMPVDPYDAFRGRYVALSLSPNDVSAPDMSSYDEPTVFYVTLATDAEGYAIFTSSSKTQPEEGDYLRVLGTTSSNGRLHVELPFDRYYMDEFQAPAAEIAYRKHSRIRNSTAHVIVRVKNGSGVIEELFIADQPIAEFLLNAPEDQVEQDP